MDYARESGGAVASTVLTPTRFVWPYGGRSVYVSGSFTGWSEHWPMTPVEGCPTVFQTICSLPPGYHQPRKGCFEICEEGGEKFISLLDMKRPFTPMKKLDMDIVISDIISKIK